MEFMEGLVHATPRDHERPMLLPEVLGLTAHYLLARCEHNHSLRQQLIRLVYRVDPRVQNAALPPLPAHAVAARQFPCPAVGETTLEEAKT